MGEFMDPMSPSNMNIDDRHVSIGASFNNNDARLCLFNWNVRLGNELLTGLGQDELSEGLSPGMRLLFGQSGYPLHPSTSGWGPTIVSIGCRTDSNRLLGEAMKAQSPSVCAGNLSLGPGVSHVPSTNVTRLLNLGQRDTHFGQKKDGASERIAAVFDGGDLRFDLVDRQESDGDAA